MKAQPVCQNCGGTKFFSKLVSASGTHGPNLLPVGWFTFGKFKIRVCGVCGLVTWFVPEALLPKVKEKFDQES